jgi:sulfotransferase
MNKQFYFLSGLPRSGSTLLSAILNQHPKIYVTPTSPLLDLLVDNQNAWHKCPSVLANPIPKQLTNLTRAMINSAWEHIDKPIIIDKNRGWGKNMPASTILFEKEIKVIATTRDLPSIMASWLTLIYNNSNNNIDKVIKQKGFEPTDENRMAEMWFNMVKDCMESLQQLKKDAGNRLLLISYDEIINDAYTVLTKIEEFLEISHFSYNLNNIESKNKDNDLLAWGMDGIHSIRKSITKISKDPQEILGESLFNRFIQLEKQFK